MKKNILFTLSIFFLFIGIIKAENCIVTSGTGKEFGDEVKCGTEPFYVIDYNENTTKLLAKYNLYVGDIIDYLEADETAPKNLTWDEYAYNSVNAIPKTYCMNYAKSKGRNPYYAVAFVKRNGTTYSNFTYDVIGCRIYEKIEYEHVKQNEKAIGTTFKSDGTSYYPQIGITYMNEKWGYDYIHDNIEYKNEYDGPLSIGEYCRDKGYSEGCGFISSTDDRSAYGDLILEGSSFEKYINGYKDELERQDINYKDVDFLHLSGFKDIYKKITNEDLYLKFAYEGYLQSEEENVDYHASGKLPLADKIPEKYKWLYATTFWLGSGSLWETEIKETDAGVSEYNDYYFTTEGILCSLGRGICQYTDIPIGGGVRPVLTINNEYIKQAISEDSSVKENPNTKDIAIILLLVLAITTASIAVVNSKRLKEII